MFIVLFLIITVLFVIFVRANLEYHKRAAQINVGVLGIIIGLAFMNRLLAGLKIKAATHAFGVKLPFTEWYGMAVISNFYNNFISKSGVALAASYAKKNHEFPYSRYLSFMMGDVLLMLVAAGILGSIVSAYAVFYGLLEGWILSGVFFCILLAAVCIILIPTIKFPDKGIFAKVNNVMHAWNTIRKDVYLVLILFLLNLLMMLVLGLRYFMIFRVFSSDIPIFICLMISPANIIIQVASIIPGAYGVREAILGLITKLANFGFVPGTMASLVDRVIMMVIAFIQGPIFSYFLIKRTGLKLEEVSDEE